MERAKSLSFGEGFRVRLMNPKLKNFFFFFLGAFGMMLLMYLFNNYKIEKKNEQNNQEISYQKSETQNQDNSYSYEKSSKQNSENYQEKKSDFSNDNASSGDIAELTNENVVINYVKTHHELPAYYITKSEAKRNGWNPGESLCDAVPGKAIGGDHFSNREGNFPKGEQYFEADVNYECGHRNAERIVFTKSGKVWVTHNHYKSFEER